MDRYLAEFQSEEDRKKSASDALEAYREASNLANQDLPPTHPIRLGLALNFSVFYYEILNSPDRACGLAKAVSQMIYLWILPFPAGMIWKIIRRLCRITAGHAAVGSWSDG